MNAHNRQFMDQITEDDVIDAEAGILSAILANNELLGDTGLEASDFLDNLHDVIFEGATKLYAGHQRINAVSLKPFVSASVGTGDMTPAEYLAKLQLNGARPQVQMAWEGNLQIVKGASLSRQLEREAEFAANLCREGHTLNTVGDEIERMEGRLRDLRSRFAETSSIVSPGAAYLAAFNAASKSDGVIGVPIALPEIAKVMSEPVFEAGNLYGMLSSSGEGKSSMTMQLIHHAVKKGHPVLFLSYDQSAQQCVRQMIAQVYGIDVRQQRDPSKMMSQTEVDTCVAFSTWIDKQPIEIIRCQREGVERLTAYARRFIKKRGNGKTPFIVIDHIGKIKPRDPRLTPDRISGEIAVELKALADELKAAVLILQQRNTFGTKRDNPRPIAADLYGGEGARADFDSIMYLYRPEKYMKDREAIAATDADWNKIRKVFGSDVEGKAEIGVIKSRFGDVTLREMVEFQARYTRYVSLNNQDDRELF